VQVARTLQEHGADLDAVARYRGISDATPLLSACWTSGNPALVSWLLEEGALATEAHLMAALGHLQRHGRGAYDVAKVLASRGVTVDSETPQARTPLQAFANQADHRAVAWLLAHGAKVNARGPGGRTAAHFSAERNTSPKTLSLLVEHGADLSARDDDGRTPLEVAKLHEKPVLVTWIAQRVYKNKARSSPRAS
jgi:ankyrin repeat protein